MTPRGRLWLGAHESIAGGPSRAFERAAADGAEAVQIFTKNARGWAATPIPREERARFRAAAAAARIPVIAHASYLVNLAAEAPVLREKSIAAMAEEVARCEALGIPDLVVHPGSHPDPERGAVLAASALGEIRRLSPQGGTHILLENSAGQGHGFGRRFEDLAAIRRAAGRPSWLGYCLDTCHLFAAGYDIASAGGWREVAETFDAIAGLPHVRALHLNDSKGPLGCRVDRHEDIGKGHIGLPAFAALLSDPRLAGIPGLLETEDGRQSENLAALRALLGAEAKA